MMCWQNAMMTNKECLLVSCKWVSGRKHAKNLSQVAYSTGNTNFQRKNKDLMSANLQDTPSQCDLLCSCISSVLMGSAGGMDFNGRSWTDTLLEHGTAAAYTHTKVTEQKIPLASCRSIFFPNTWQELSRCWKMSGPAHWLKLMNVLLQSLPYFGYSDFLSVVGHTVAWKTSSFLGYK